MYVHGGKVKLFKKEHVSRSANRKPKKTISFMGFVKKMFAFGILIVTAFYLFPEDLFQNISKEKDSFLHNLDLRVKDINIIGNDKVREMEILDMTGVTRGENIYDIDIVDMKLELEKHPWIKSVVIERMLPSKINIIIEENVAKAVYEKNNNKYLVSADGQLLQEIDDNFNTSGFLIIKGTGANLKYMELMEELYYSEFVYNEIKSLHYLGNRRWNVELASGAVIKLPENNVKKALERLDVLLKKNNILTARCEIDLRFTNNKIYVRL